MAEETSKPNYKIYVLEYDPKYKYQERKTIATFFAKDDEEARKYLNDNYVNTTNDNRTYYYGAITYHNILKEDGTIVQKSSEEAFLLDDEGFFRRTIDNICTWFRVYVIDKIFDFKYWLRDLFYFIKHKQYYRASWSLDTYILDTIEHNLKRLMEYKHGYTQKFIDAAILKVHANEKDFDLEAYKTKNNYNATEEEMAEAEKIFNEECQKCIEYIQLYRYYEGDYSSIDITNPEEVALDKKYRHTLPIKPGTYCDIYDYNKLYELEQEAWCKVFDWFKENGQSCWD